MTVRFTANRVPCIEEWAKTLHQRFGGPIAIALELGCPKEAIKGANCSP